jgi:hypothetical protein
MHSEFSDCDCFLFTSSVISACYDEINGLIACRKAAGFSSGGQWPQTSYFHDVASWNVRGNDLVQCRWRRLIEVTVDNKCRDAQRFQTRHKIAIHQQLASRNKRRGINCGQDAPPFLNDRGILGQIFRMIDAPGRERGDRGHAFLSDPVGHITKCKLALIGKCRGHIGQQEFPNPFLMIESKC